MSLFRKGTKGILGVLLASPFGRGGCDQREQTERVHPAPLRGAAAAAAEGPINRRSEKKVQRRRPPPAADAGRSCWGSGQQDTSAAQGTKWTLGTAVLSGSLLVPKENNPLSKPLSPAAPPPPAGPARPAGRRPAAPRSHSIPRRCRAAHAEPARPQRPLPAP